MIDGNSTKIVHEYDQGGNRTSKTDWTNGTCVIYHYDTDADSTAPHEANRLMSYETRELVGTACTGNVIEEVVYEYALQGRAAGNPTQIMRRVPVGASHHVYSTCFKYNEQGELWVAMLRTWWDFGGSISPVKTWKSRQFRGIGQQRYMMRDLDTTDEDFPTFAILPARYACSTSTIPSNPKTESSRDPAAG